VLLARTVDRGFGKFLEQGMGLAVEHTIALLDGGLADGLDGLSMACARCSSPDEAVYNSQSG
jgi:hypothetical protein